MGLVWNSEKAATISLNNIHQLVFLSEKRFVSLLMNWTFNDIQTSFGFKDFYINSLSVYKNVS
jgi:hypothetical protein